jgi:hypothetical protein
MPIATPNANAIRFHQFDESSRTNRSRLGGVQVYFQDESDQLMASKPKTQLTELTAQKITGLLYCTDELAADSDAYDAWSRWAVSQELTFRNCQRQWRGSAARYSQFPGVGDDRKRNRPSRGHCVVYQHRENDRSALGSIVQQSELGPDL